MKFDVPQELIKKVEDLNFPKGKIPIPYNEEDEQTLEERMKSHFELVQETCENNLKVEIATKSEAPQEEIDALK